MQHHLALPAWRGGCGSVVAAEVEGVLGAGQVAGRDGAAHVQGLGRAQQELLVGVRGERGVQVQRVGQVEVALDADPCR